MTDASETTPSTSGDAGSQAGAQQATTTTTTMAEAEASARAQADALNANLLSSDQERKYALLKEKTDNIQKTCTDQENQISALEKKVSNLQKEASEKDATLALTRERAENETKRATKSEEREKDVNERMARVDVEADSLRQEISRLQSNNNALNSQITELQASSTLSTSSSAPLQFENTRLRSELDSLNAHCKWLENELSTRTKDAVKLKTDHSKTLLELRNELSSQKMKHDETQSEAVALKMKNESLQKRLEASQTQLLQNEQDRADTAHELNMDIQSERRLVALNKEQISRLEDNYNDVVREMESMKSLAAAAEQEHTQEILKIKADAEEDLQKLLQEVEQENEKKIEEYKTQLDDAIAEKAQLEDEFMAGGRKAIKDGEETLRLTYTSVDGDPMTLTKLYEKLTDAEEETRRERAERKRVELYLERVRKEIEIAAPRQRQEQKEYALAMSQNQDMHSRLNEAWEESRMARNELQTAQRELRETSRECNELRLENGDMAKQVQQLLLKSLGGEDLAAEMQNQNQRLMAEHNSMSITIAELQEKMDNDVVQQKLQELESMKEEMQNQATLVSNIIQQRDLYRALLVKNDTAILADLGEEGSTAIVAAKDQIEKYTEVETKNKEMADTIAKLSAELTSTNNTKIGVEERLSRLETHSNELSNANAKLQAEVSAAHASAARSNAESSFHQQKVVRIEETLEILRGDLNRATNDKSNLQLLNEKLQTALSQSKNNESRAVEESRQITVQLQLAETKCNSLTETEVRLNAENNSLRSENARHVALQDSMQKIEASLSARGAQDESRLKDELSALSSKLESEKSKYATEIENMQNQLADADLFIKEAEKKKEEALTKTINVSKDLLQAKTEVQNLSKKCASLESDLNAAKIKLGDDDADSSDKEKIESLAHKLEATRAELQAANKKAEDFKNMSAANEKALAESTKAGNEFKTLTTAEIKKLKTEVKEAKELAKTKQEALDGISKDLTRSRGEQEKTADELKVKIESLKTELLSSKSDKESTQKLCDDITSEMTIYRADAKAAKDNYERELALHADARKELQKARQSVETEIRSRQTAETQLQNVSNEIVKERDTWEATKKQLEDTHNQAQSRLAGYQDQNKILHTQLATLNETLEKMKSEKINALSEENDTAKANVGADDPDFLAKQLSEVREVMRFMQEEKQVVEAQLQSSRRAAERDRAAAEIAKRSLEQLRSEMKILEKDRNQNQSTEVPGESFAVETKLKQAEDQLTLLRESNKLLREETEKLTNSLARSESQAQDAKKALEPTQLKCQALEVDKAAFGAEKESLIREVDAWKDRVNSLVTKFNQIDPEEHKEALKNVEEAKKECISLRVAKENAEKASSGAKSIISRLNSEIAKQKSISQSTKAALDKVTLEKDKLVKSNAGSAASSKKEAEDAKKARSEAEKKLKAAEEQLKTQGDRVTRLTQILRQNKTTSTNMKKTLEEKLKKEQNEKAVLEAEREQLKSLLKKQNAQDSRPPLETAKPTSDQIISSKTNEAENTSESITEVPTDIKPDAKTSKGSVDVAIIPKVPAEGFKFIASKKSDPNISAKTNIKQQEKPSTQGSTQLVEDRNKKNDSLKKVNVPSEMKKDNLDLKTRNDGSETPAKSSTPTNTTNSTDKRPLPPKKVAPVSKPTVPAPLNDTSKNSAVLPPKKVAPLSKPTVPAPLNDTSKEVVDREKTDTFQSSRSTMNSLKEKLMMKKKRQREEKINSPPAKRSTPAPPVSSMTLNSTPKISIKDANEPTSEDIKSTNKPADKIDISKAAKQMSESSSKDVPSKSTEISKEGNTILVKDTLETVGNVSTTESQLSAKANPFQPLSSKTPAAAKKSEPQSAFLDLKPPGSGGTTPLIFGSSSNITLPMPSKLPVGKKPIDSFESKPFGTNPFAPTTKQQSSSLFGGTIVKKRQLETGEEEQSAPAKLARVDEESSSGANNTKESTDTEKQPESES